eukprot:171716_1
MDSLKVVICVVFSLWIQIGSSTTAFNKLPYSEVTKFKGEIRCNTEIATTNTISLSNHSNHKFDAWKLSMNNSVCINIYTDTNISINNSSNINIFDCNGFLMDASNDYLSSSKCKFEYFIQLHSLHKYKLKVLCNNNIQCHKSNDKEIIGYLKQVIYVRRLLDNSNSDDSSDDSQSDDDTLNPSVNPSEHPSEHPSAHPS